MRRSSRLEIKQAKVKMLADSNQKTELEEEKSEVIPLEALPSEAEQVEEDTS